MIYSKKYLSVVFIFFFFNTQVLYGYYAKNDSLNINKKILNIVVPTSMVVTNIALYFAWYKNYNTNAFHLFNDNAEWQGMDKLGHSYSTFSFSKLIINYAQKAKYTKPKHIITYGCYGLFFLTAIEIQDGFSNGWGFSFGDMLANTGGTALAIGQYYLFNKQFPFQIKYNYFPSKYAQYRPSLLGENGISRILKDYNGQQYWLSFFPGQLNYKNKIPAFIGVSLGYSATGMLGANSNPLVNNKNLILPIFQREKQIRLSLDLDLSKLAVKNKFLKNTFELLSVIKIPFPQVYLQKGRFYTSWY